MEQPKTVEEMLKDEGIKSDSPFYETVISVIDVQQAVESMILQLVGNNALTEKLRELVAILNESFEIRSLLCKKQDFNLEVLKQAKENYIPRIVDADKRIIEGINMLFRIPEENKEEAIGKLQEIASLGVKIDKFNFDKLNLGISNKIIRRKNETEIDFDVNKKLKYKPMSPFMPPEVAYHTNEWLNKTSNEYVPNVIPIIEEHRSNYENRSSNVQNYYRNRRGQNPNQIQNVPQTSEHRKVKLVDRFKQNIRNKKRVGKSEVIKIVGVMSLTALLAIIATGIADKNVDSYAHKIVDSATTSYEMIDTKPTSVPSVIPTVVPNSKKINNVKCSSYISTMTDEKINWFTTQLQKNRYLKPQNQTEREFVNEFYEDFFNIYKNGDERSCQLIAEEMNLFVMLDLKYEIANSLKNNNPTKYAELTPENIEIDFDYSTGKYIINAFGERICKKGFDDASKFSKGMFGLYEVERLWVKKFNRNEGKAVGSRELDGALQNLGSYMQACEENGKLEYSHKYGFEFETDLKMKQRWEQER